MCFSLFKSKSKLKSKPEPKMGKSPSHFPTTSTGPTTPTGPTTSSSYYTNNFYSSKSSSLSSRASLSSLKDNLPENTQIYDLTEIRTATKNFLMKPISSSSSSSSWKCVLGKKDMIVIQRKLRRSLTIPQLRKIISILGKSHHANLIKLYGACVNGNYIYLVYQYVSGASLSDCLRNPRNPNFTVLSNWLSRVQIIAGVADGLDYLHNCVGFKEGFINNHVKSSSIVVSDETLLTAKICHFGTAQLCGEVPELVDLDDGGNGLDGSEVKRVGSSAGKFEGARGYMSPEFQVTGVPSLKSDVFAFGVVMLEVLSGEEPLKIRADPERGVFRKVSLIETARDAVEKGGVRLRQWMDRRLKDSYPIEVAEGLARVALECIQDDPVKRPDMGRVAGWISKLYLDSTNWAQSFGIPDEISVSFAPR